MDSRVSLSLTDFITTLKRELGEASSLRKAGDAALVVKEATIEVEVTTEVDTKAEGGLKFYVAQLKGGASRKKGVTHRLKLDLVPDRELLLGAGSTTSQLDE